MGVKDNGACLAMATTTRSQFKKGVIVGLANPPTWGGRLQVNLCDAGYNEWGRDKRSEKEEDKNGNEKCTQDVAFWR
ncbi:uncharacterized protein G2W53_044087 [Senna tora]|uniref:Uncharacterized protein n=1 Tax=Senna tora TaxID=362788 RepID=A0A834SJY4_9FABA|nr:uncharacterized protein G2W53_044087 [Senna tora]